MATEGPTVPPGRPALGAHAQICVSVLNISAGAGERAKGTNATRRGRPAAAAPGKPEGSAIVTVFVVAHGAWSAAWAWKKMRPLPRAAGHELWTPTYTGLGERAHLASPTVDLDTHIADVIGVLEMEDLRDVVLIAHSYGGMVATGVADRAREAHRAARLSRRVRAARRPKPVRPAIGGDAHAHARSSRAPTARAGACRRPRCRRTHPMPTWPGRRAAGGRSRSRRSSSPCVSPATARRLPQLHLLPTQRTGGCVPPVRRARPA